MTGELVSATHLVMVMANASNWADLFDDSERDALRLVVTEVTNAQAIIAEKDRRLAELAASLDGIIKIRDECLTNREDSEAENRIGYDDEKRGYLRWGYKYELMDALQSLSDPVAILAAHDADKDKRTLSLETALDLIGGLACWDLEWKNLTSEQRDAVCQIVDKELTAKDGDFSPILEAYGNALTGPLEARIAELQAQVKTARADGRALALREVVANADYLEELGKETIREIVLHWAKEDDLEGV